MRDAVLLAEHKTSASVDPDEALVLAARTDPDAFGALYERHRLAVYRYLRTRTSTEDDAIELTSMTFERALRSAMTAPRADRVSRTMGGASCVAT